MAQGTVLEQFPLVAYRRFSPLFEEDVFEAIDLAACVERRISKGGPSEASVQQQLEIAERIFGGKK